MNRRRAGTPADPGRAGTPALQLATRHAPHATVFHRLLAAVALLLLPLVFLRADVVEVRFDKQLALREGVVLRGINETRTIPFTVPVSRELKSARAVIRFRHSPALIEASTLTVAVNGTPLQTVRLTAANAADGTIEAAIPVNLLKEYNRLELLGSQHYTTSCEDPFEASLWTAVLSESRLNFDYGRLKHAPRLDEFPTPVADVFDYREPAVRFVIPGGASAAVFGTAAAIAGSLGRALQYRSARLTAASDLDPKGGTAQVLVGTFADIQRLPGGNTLIANASARAKTGYLRLVESSAGAGTFILVVSGADEEGLRKAAGALLSRNPTRALAATQVIVEDVHAPATAPHSDYLPQASSFRLHDFPPQGGLSALTVRGLNPGPITLRLRPRGGQQFVRYEQRLRLEYSYGPQLETSRSSIEVVLNGRSVGGEALNREGGSEKRVLDVLLPHNLLGLDNKLQVIFHLYPRNWNHCQNLSTDYLWATVADTSALQMPRDRQAALPDLALLKHDGYPIADGPAAFVIPSAPQPEETSLLLAFAFWLGQVAGAAPGQAYFDASLPADVRQSTHLVAVGSASANTLIRSLSDQLTFGSAERRTRLGTLSGIQLSAEQTAHIGFIEQMVSPWNEERTVLVVGGVDPLGVQAAQSGLAEPELFPQIAGSLVLFPGGRTAYSFDLAEKRTFGTISLTRRLKYWLIDNSLWFFLATLAFVVALFFLARYVRRHYFMHPTETDLENSAASAD